MLTEPLSQHATEDQVRRASSSSVYDIQSRYHCVLSVSYSPLAHSTIYTHFGLQQKYDEGRTQASCEMDEVVLAKVSLLLSLWCPPKSEITINSLWADRAMHHTKRYLKKASPVEFEPMPKRRDILLWCCITRKTFISYAMHRPYLISMDDEPLCDPDSVRSEFDRELLFHNFCSTTAKVRMVDDFVIMCKLSQTLGNIMLMQRSMLSTIQSSEQISSAWGMDEHESSNCLSRYLNAAAAEAELMELIEEHESFKRQAADRGSGERTSELVAARMRSYMLQIMTL